MVDPDQARREALEILSRPPFRAARPGLLQRLLERLVEPIAAVVGRLSAGVSGAIEGVGPLPAALAAIVVLAGFAFLASRLARRPGRAGRSPEGLRGAQGPADPRQLERAALEAEADGRLEEALRLRFRAGIARLEQAGRLPARPLTNAAIARIVASERFAGLSRSFDEVVFGGRSATGEDLDSARHDWPALIQESRIQEGRLQGGRLKGGHTP